MRPDREANTAQEANDEDGCHHMTEPHIAFIDPYEIARFVEIFHSAWLLCKRQVGESQFILL